MQRLNWLAGLRNRLPSSRWSPVRRRRSALANTSVAALESRQLLVATVTSASFVNSGSVDINTSSVSVTFSQSVVGANNTSNYELRRQGADGLLGNGDDVIVSITSANVVGNTATLNFATLPQGVYRLTVKDTITDGSVAIDGDGDGNAGGNWVRDFVVTTDPVNLTTAGGQTIDVESQQLGTGQLVQGPSGAFDGLNRLQVNGSDYTPPAPPQFTDPAVDIVAETTSTGSDVTLTNTFTAVSGLSTSLTVSDAAERYRFSAELSLSTNVSTTTDFVVEAAFFVDGVQGYTQQFELGARNSAGFPSQFQINIEDYAALTTGGHSVDVRVRTTVGSAAVILDGTSNTHTFHALRYRPRIAGNPSVTIISETTNTGADTALAGGAGFTTISGLTSTFTVTDTAERYRLSSQLNFLANSNQITVAYVDVAFFVDGVQGFTQRFEFNRRNSEVNDPSQFHIDVEDYLQLATGSHTIDVRVANPSTINLAVDGINSSNSFRVLKYNPQRATVPAVDIVAEQSFTGTEYNPTTTFQTPQGLTSTFTVADPDERYRLSADLNLYTFNIGSFGNFVLQAAFFVDGVQGSTQEFQFNGAIPNSPTDDVAQFHINLEDYLALAAGSHTVDVRLRITGAVGITFDGNFTTQSFRVLRINPFSYPVRADSNQTLTTAAQTLAGLTVNREMTVPSTGSLNFVRTIDTFTNSTGSAIAAPVKVVGNLGSDAATTVFMTSDGDNIVETTDWWFGTDDADGTGTPAVIHLLHGPAGVAPDSVSVTGDNVEWTYNLNVAAGQTKQLAHFTVLGTTRAQAIAAANALVTTNGLTPEAAVFLSSSEWASLANFQSPTTMIFDDGESSVTTTGPWVYYAAGRGGDVRYIGANAAAGTASWNFDGIQSGQYRVSATWLGAAPSLRASNAPYSIRETASGPILKTAAINQSPNPDDFTDAGSAWEDLGTVTINGNSLVVQLTNVGADNYVVADAIRIERVGNAVTAPEIAVAQGTTAIEDGGSLAFGNTTTGTPVSKTLTITNAGNANLVLQPATLPPGYSIVGSNFTSGQIVAAGASTTLTVRLDAATVGNYGGLLSFATNDSDEASFDITLSGSVYAPADVPVLQIIDNGDAGYSTTGSWISWPGDGRDGDLQYLAATAAPGTATWAFTGLNAGQYRVSATWTTHSNRATNAPYVIRETNGGPILTSVSMNQELQPNDLLASGTLWEDLGVVTVNGTTLRVELSNVGANEYVIADAIRIERIGAVPTAPEISVQVGSDNVLDGTGSVSFGTATQGTPIQKTLTIYNTGTANLVLQPATLPSGYSIVGSNFTSGQVVAAGGSTTLTVQLDAALVGSYAGELSFATNDSNENPFNFAISGSVVASGNEPVIQIIDDGDVGFSLPSGNWENWPNSGRGVDLKYLNTIGAPNYPSEAPATSGVARWAFSALPAGQYRVSATWVGGSASVRSTNAPFTIRDSINGTLLASVTRNQLAEPDDFYYDGSHWENLATVDVTGGTLVVELTNVGADNYVVADAIRIERLGPVGGGMMAGGNLSMNAGFIASGSSQGTTLDQQSVSTTAAPSLPPTTDKDVSESSYSFTLPPAVEEDVSSNSVA